VRVATQYAPAPLLPHRGRPTASCAAEQTQVLSHAEYVPTLIAAAALRVKAALRGLVTLTFDLLTLKVVSESRVTWAISMPILVFLGLSALDLGPMYTSDRQTSDKSIA